MAAGDHWWIKGWIFYLYILGDLMEDFWVQNCRTLVHMNMLPASWTSETARMQNSERRSKKRFLLMLREKSKIALADTYLYTYPPSFSELECTSRQVLHLNTSVGFSAETVKIICVLGNILTKECCFPRTKNWKLCIWRVHFYNFFETCFGYVVLFIYF